MKIRTVLLCAVLVGGLVGQAMGDAVVHEPRDFRVVVKDAKDKVFPSLVFIKCVCETHEEGKKSSQEVSGSGVIISATGEVLTNWHVVDKAVNVRCLLFDGRAMTATVIGSDQDVDLALIKLDLDDDSSGLGLPYAKLGDSENVKEGDFVMAMGAPWGMSRSVSMGIISSARRYLPGDSEYSLWLQTDAAICPGNSGGPLVDTNGDVIGINTLGIMFGGDVGFAVPSSTIRRVVEQLREHGRMCWSWTGLQLQPLQDFNRNIYFDAKVGVIVAGTDPQSPAREAGIQAKDRILRVNGKPLNAVTDEDLPAVHRAFGLLPKSVEAMVEIARGEELLSVRLIPREKGKVEGEELDCPRWDLTVKAINQFANPELYFHRKTGVFIFGIESPGNARDSGLMYHDILLEVDGKAVETLDEVKAAYEATVESLDKKPRIVLTVLRNGLLRQVVLDIARDYEKD